MTKIDEQEASGSRVPWNDRGVVVVQVEADFVHEASPEFWSTMADRFSLIKSPFGRSGKVTAASFATRLDEGTALVTMTGYFHPFADEPHRGHCTITLKRSPKRRGQEGTSTDLGDPLGRMAEGWEGSRLVDCSISASYFVDPKRWQTRFALPRGRSVNIEGRRVALQPDMASWELDEGQVPPLSEVSVSVGSRQEPIIIRGAGQQELGFGRDLLQQVDDAIWRALKNFLKPVSGE